MRMVPLFLCLATGLLSSGCTNALKGLTGKSSGAASSAYDPIGDFDSKQSGLSADKVRLLSGMDLVIAIDTSGSMKEEKEAVEENIQQLLLDLQKSDLDPRIHVIAGGRDGRQKDKEEESRDFFTFPIGIEVARAALVSRKVGSNDALGRVSSLLAGELDDRYLDVNGEPMDEPLGFRNGAQLEVLVVSDDDGSNMVGRDEDFGNLAEDFDPENIWKATVSGIIGLPNSAESDGSCEIARVGEEYITLAQRTGGTLLDICSKDWSMLLKRFSTEVKKRSASLLLTKIPLGADRILVTLNGKNLGPDAWTYNEKENRVYLAPSTGFGSGMVLEAKYVHQR